MKLPLILVLSLVASVISGALKPNVSLKLIVIFAVLTTHLSLSNKLLVEEDAFLNVIDVVDEGNYKLKASTHVAQVGIKALSRIVCTKAGYRSS